MNLNINKLNNDGFIKFKGHLFGEDSLNIAKNLGKIANIPDADLVQTLIPNDTILKEASSYSGIYGLNEFPFHTDMAHWYHPPRYLLLRCITPSKLVSTNILKASQLFENEDINDLRRAIFRPRRRLDGRLCQLRLFEGDFYRWDPLFIQPITKLAKLLQLRIAERISNATPEFITFLHHGDCVLIDNWHTFHARSSIPNEALHRKLERIYITELKV